MKNYLINIPNNTKIIYCNKNKILTFIGPFTVKSLLLPINIILKKNTIILTKESFIRLSKNKIKNIKVIQGTLYAFIKQCVINVTAILYQKLKLVGIGYKVFEIEKFNKTVYMMKLGFSHFLYFKINNNLKFFSLKLIKLFFYGNSLIYLTQFSSMLRSYKKPEPYKGKGILYENESIKLKKGKKV